MKQKKVEIKLEWIDMGKKTSAKLTLDSILWESLSENVKTSLRKCSACGEK